MEEHSSAMLMATHWMKAMAMSHPQTMPGVPAYPIPCCLYQTSLQLRRHQVVLLT